jgi:hypothetical protein
MAAWEIKDGVKCGRVHRGPCLVNGSRPAGTIGPVCMACGKAMDGSQRDALQARHDMIASLADWAGAKLASRA